MQMLLAHYSGLSEYSDADNYQDANFIPNGHCFFQKFTLHKIFVILFLILFFFKYYFSFRYKSLCPLPPNFDPFLTQSVPSDSTSSCKQPWLWVWCEFGV